MRKDGKNLIIRTFIPKANPADQELWFETTAWAKDLAKVLDKQTEAFDSMMTVTELYQKEYHKISNLYIKLTVCPWWNFKERARLRGQLISEILEEVTHNKLMIEFKKLENLSNELLNKSSESK